MSYLQQLQQGKIALHFDVESVSKDNVADLNRVLKYCFPKDVTTAAAVKAFYRAHHGNKEAWIGVWSLNMPAYPLQKFIDELNTLNSSFVLPERWCVRIGSKETLEYFNLPSSHADLYLPHSNGVLITEEQFIKHVYNKSLNAYNTTFMDPKQLPYNITPDNAQAIINLACQEWKGKLASMWGAKIVMYQNILVSKEFYKEMRAACTKPQHDLFDKIFGKDLPAGPYKDGELILVKSQGYWILRYSNGKCDESGKVLTYVHQHKQGLIAESWEHHAKLPEGFKLPD